MSDTNRTTKAQLDLIATWDERKRLFEKMRDQRLTDEDREALATEYKAACRAFEKAKQEATK